jgi:hypothetical protein
VIRRYRQVNGRLVEVGIVHRPLGPNGTVMDLDDIKADCERHKRERAAQQKRDRTAAVVRAYDEVMG